MHGPLSTLRRLPAGRRQTEPPSKPTSLKNVSNQMVKCGPYTNYGNIPSANVTTQNQLRDCIADYQRQGYERAPGP